MTDKVQKPATPKAKTRAEEIRDCENSLRSLESRRVNLAGRFEGAELAKRVKPVEEKIRERQAKLDRLKKGDGGEK